MRKAEIEVGKTYEVLDGSGSNGYFTKGDKVTPVLTKTQTTKGIVETLCHGVVHEDMVMFGHVRSKNIGLFLTPGQVKLVS